MSKSQLQDHIKKRIRQAFLFELSEKIETFYFIIPNKQVLLLNML